ncbi:hypothetical protein CYY_001877 [Polysphondylium violaceum]|uniref:SH2 domain-containing protein n=1 Tax=Polysphondylium violaceum TaxID=133409 RepID=A0A8J4V180_9MYCE|nr:hypothetical protein CYY_001877 [Polysphondylium violaceum]
MARVEPNSKLTHISGSSNSSSGISSSNSSSSNSNSNSNSNSSSSSSKISRSSSKEERLSSGGKSSKSNPTKTTISTETLDLIVSYLISLQEYHQKFENNSEDLDNFINYVNRLLYLKRKIISLIDITSGDGVLTDSKGRKVSINELFIYIDKLKKSQHIASDLFEISCNNPVLVPMGPINRVDHYNQAPIIVPKFNQAVYYNCGSSSSKPSSLSSSLSASPTMAPKTLASSTSTTSLSSLTSSTSTTTNLTSSSVSINTNLTSSSSSLCSSASSIYGNCPTPPISSSSNSINNSSSGNDLLKNSLNSSSNNLNNSSSSSSNNIIPIPIPIQLDGSNRFELNGVSTLSSSTNISNVPISSSPPLSVSPFNNSLFNNNNQVKSFKNNNTSNSNSSAFKQLELSPVYVDDGYTPPISTLSFEKLSLDDFETTTTLNTTPINDLLDNSNNIKQQEPNTEPVRNWSLDFWNALQMDHNCGNESLIRSQRIQQIAEEFVSVATKHGMTIIQEKGKSFGWTIPPYDVGGVAGGLKYLKDGIFFKFAVDVYGIYGGNAFAMKSAGHELKGLMGYFNCQIDGLYLPLMALIDYMGYRLIATSQLAIDGDNTLVYGSNDGGDTVHNKSQAMDGLMKQASEILNLKGHYTGQGENKVFLYGPCDIEGHITKDNHYVIIDTARVFPPEKPIPGKIGSHLYNLLRPELVRSNKLPLSSDAFTKFSGPDSEQNNEDVERSQKRLFVSIIPNFVLSLNQKVRRSKCENILELSHMLMLVDSMHREGINVRYLNRLKKTDIIAIDHRLSAILNTEIIARKIKNRLREFLRNETSINKEKIAQFLTRMVIISLLQSCDLDGFSLELLLHRLQQMTGFVFRDGLARSLETSHIMHESDIISITPKVKFLHMVPYQQGVALFHQAISASKLGTTDEGGLDDSTSRADKIFQQASDKFKQAIQSKPDDYEILTHWGILFFMRAKLLSQTKDYIQEHGSAEIEKLYETAIEKFQQAVKIKRNHHYAIFNWAEALKNWSAIKPAVEANSLEKLSKLKLQEAGVFEKKWFFGTLETNGAASLLSGKEAGSFIIRNSNSRPGSFVFSYLSDPHRKIQHSIIKSSSHGYHVENLPPRKVPSSPNSSGHHRSGSRTGSSSKDKSSSKNEAIQFNEAGTTIPTRNSTSLSSQTPVTTVSYKTLEEFVSDKIKQGYIPITKGWDE